MRVASLALAALPFSTLAMAHIRPLDRANRLSRVEGRWQERNRRAGVLGGLLGGDADGDDTSSVSLLLPDDASGLIRIVRPT